MSEGYDEALRRIEEARATGATTLSLSRLGLEELPPELWELTSLTRLGAGFNLLRVLPERIGKLRALTSLFLRNNQLSTLPEGISELGALSSLDVSQNHLRVLPEAIGSLTGLTSLNLDHNQLRSLPETAVNLLGLDSLYVSHNQIQTLPEDTGNLSALSSLYLGHNHLRALPESIGNLSNLALLNLTGNQLAKLPKDVGKLSSLTTLHLDENRLIELPESVGGLVDLTELDLLGNRLTALPRGIGDLASLETLDLSHNDLQSLSPGLRNPTQLKALYLHGNEALGLPNGLLGPIAIDVYGGMKPSPPAEILAYYFEHNPPPSRAPSNPFHSCFISYTHTDKPFARRLYDALQARGIECWLDEKDLRPGDPILDHVNEAIRTRDKMLLCCSEQSLTSYWVDTEIGAAIQAERKTGSYRLIPLDLDGFLLNGWDGPKADIVRSRLAADFTGWETDGGRFEAALEGVVSALGVGETPVSQTLPSGPAQKSASSPGNPTQELYTRFLSSALRVFRLCRDRQRQMARPDQRALSAVSLPITKDIAAARQEVEEMFNQISLLGSGATCEAAQGMLKAAIMADAWSMTSTDDGKQNVEAEHRKMLDFRDQFLVSARTELGLDHFRVLNKGAERDSG